MNLKERLARLEFRARKTAARGDQRHHDIDAAFDELEQVRERLVDTFTTRLDQIEANTASIAANLERLEQIETKLDAHVTEKAGKAHK